MLAKFTPFGKHNVGKTTVLRILTYLLYLKADPKCYVHFQRTKTNDRGKIYNTPSFLPVSTIFKQRGKDKSADWRISFNTIIPVEGIDKSVRIAIATIGDIEEEIVKNWDFSYNNYIYKLPSSEPAFIKPDFFISPCSEGRAQEEEKLEQNWHIQNGNMIDSLYWFRLPIEDNLKMLLDKKEWGIDIHKLYEELEKNRVFDAGKRASSTKKMSLQNKMDSIKIALLIESKIQELVKIF